MSIKHFITISIEMDQTPQGDGEQGFKDSDEMLRWITGCLNVNTNHVKATVAAAQAPTVIIEMDGGLIQAVSSSHDVRVITLDEDLDGADEEGIKEIDGRDAYCRNESVEVDPDYVAQIAREVDATD